MGTIIGIIVGALATFLVSRYYYRRSTRKSLKPYIILNARVFGGIEAEVRKELHFSFRGEEVKELQHLQFLIANDGERAISNLIEPLRLTFPAEHRILDASVLHKSSDSLAVEIRTEPTEQEGTVLIMNFPLLNKGDYFAIKILLSGFIPSRNLLFKIVADDLPRSIRPERLPRDAILGPSKRVEWPIVVGGIVVVLLGGATGYVLNVVRTMRPELLPFPWSTFHFSFAAVPLLITALIGIALLILGIMAVTSGFGGVVRRRPAFRLPTELHRHSRILLGPDFGEVYSLEGGDEFADFVEVSEIPTIDSRTDKGEG
jgi:hypothetical protein